MRLSIRMLARFDQLLKGWAVLFSLALALYWWPGPVPFEAPKEGLLLAGFISGLLLLLGVVRQGEWAWPSSKVLLPASLYLAWSGASILFGADVVKSVAGNYYRVDGWLTLLGTAGAGWVLAAVWQAVGSRWVVRPLVLGAGAVSVWAVAEVCLGAGLAGAGASFGNPVLLAGYLAAVLPLARFEAKQVESRWWQGWSIIPVLGLIATFSWGGWIAAGIVWGMELWVERKYALALGLLAGAMAGSVLAVQMTQERGFVAEGRSRIYQGMIRGFEKRPQGYGIANADYAFEAGVSDQGIGHDVLVDKAHNLVLEELVTKGVIGVGLWGWMVVSVVKGWYQRLWGKGALKSRVWLLVLISYLAIGMVNVTSVSTEVLFWLGVWLAGKEED